MAILEVRHTTHYDYSETVGKSYNFVHVMPRDDQYQSVLGSELIVDPNPDYRYHLRDYFDNHAEFFSNRKNHRQLNITAESRVLTKELSIDEENSTPCGAVRAALRNIPELRALTEYTCPSHYTPHDEHIMKYARTAGFDDKPIFRLAREITNFIHKEFEYKSGITDVDTLPGEVWKLRAGVCQDFTHLALNILRSAGLPCRYVSGYLQTYKTPTDGEEDKNPEKLIGSDESHAWISVFCPKLGWFDYDPTNGKSRTDEYITTAVGRDYIDVSPTRGVIFGGGTTKLKVNVSVRRVKE